MAALDYSYIADLAVRARDGDSDACVELFASTYQKQYLFACTFLENERLAREALEETYITALKSLASLDDPRLFVSWLNQLNFRICYRLVGKLGNGRTMERQIGQIGSKQYNLQQVMALPFSESQAIFLRFFRGMKIKQIADLMEIGKGAARRYIASGKSHLAQSPAVRTGVDRAVKKREIFIPPMSSRAAAEMIAEVLAICELPPCSATLEELASYAEYRRDRYSMQKAVLIVILAVFLLLPVCFSAPRFDVEKIEITHTGIPTYEVTVRNHIPVKQVSAVLNGHSAAVYESDRGIYTVEPASNGKLTVTVTLANMQYREWTAEVSGVDSEAPSLQRSQIIDGILRIYVADGGVGMDYDKAYARSENGGVIPPAGFSAEEGYLEFRQEGTLEIFIPDRNGNILRLVVSPEQ